MSEITVRPQGDDLYRVVVDDKLTSTSHVVRAPEGDVQRLGGGASGEQLIEASFRFLLDREPKESILDRFDLTVIGRYFPDYETEIRSYLGV